MATPLKTIIQKAKRPGFFPNHYEVLGINDFGAYNPKRKLYRLQENKNEILDLSDQTKLTRLINQADKILKDSSLRSKYDQQLREYLDSTQKPSSKQPARQAKPQATAPRGYNEDDKGHMKTSAAVLGAMNALCGLGIIYLNWGFFSWYYSLFIAFIAMMIWGLLKTLTDKSLSELVTADNGIFFVFAGILYFLYNQELLILISLSVGGVLLMKSPFIRKSGLLVKTIPVICSLLFFLSLSAVPDLNEKYFPDAIDGRPVISSHSTTTQDVVIKTYVEVYGKWNIRIFPGGKILQATEPGQTYKILGPADKNDWYRIAYGQDTAFMHLTAQKGRFFQDTVWGNH